MDKNIRSYNLSVPLDGELTARIHIDDGDGNMVIDSLNGGEALLVSGTLEYSEKQGIPTHSQVNSNGQATLTLKANGSGQPWYRLPWKACNGATTWHLHLNPTVASDVTTLSNGGNLMLDLSAMIIKGLQAKTGGGNIDALLPENSGILTVFLKSGAGNITVSLPAGTVARIKATTGMGKVIMDPQFKQVDKFTYQSPDYDRADSRIDLTAESGAGNVRISTR